MPGDRSRRLSLLRESRQRRLSANSQDVSSLHDQWNDLKSRWSDELGSISDAIASLLDQFGMAAGDDHVSICFPNLRR